MSPDDASNPATPLTNIREELAEIRESQAEQRIEIKWTKWLAAAAFGASTLGQVSRFGPPTALSDLGHVIWSLL